MKSDFHNDDWTLNNDMLMSLYLSSSQVYPVASHSEEAGDLLVQVGFRICRVIDGVIHPILSCHGTLDQLNAKRKQLP